MKPSEEILEKARKRGNDFDIITIGGAGISKIVLEILEYLDKQELKEL